MGILVLSGTSTYQGKTTILGGTLVLGSPTALPAGTALAIDSSSSSTLDLGGYSATVSG